LKRRGFLVLKRGGFSSTDQLPLFPLHARDEHIGCLARGHAAGVVLPRVHVHSPVAPEGNSGDALLERRLRRRGPEQAEEADC
jgi:hypothetical protein